MVIRTESRWRDSQAGPGTCRDANIKFTRSGIVENHLAVFRFRLRKSWELQPPECYRTRLN